METNTARSKHYLEKQGWKCWTVEQTVRIPARPGVPAKMFKRDCYNFGDLICYSAAERERQIVEAGKEIYEYANQHPELILQAHYYSSVIRKTVNSGIALIQTTSRSNQAERIKKILSIPEAEGWLAAGGRIFVHGWKLTGPRGSKAKQWEVQVTELGPNQEVIPTLDLPLFQKEEEF